MEMPGSEVLNLAVIGHTSLQELQMLGTEAFLLEPRIVCDVFFELQDNSRRGFEVSNSAVSALGAMVDRLFPRLRELVMRTLRPEEQDLEVSPQEIERRAGAYAKNAITMDRLARALGFRFLVVLQPLSPARPKARARYRRFVELASQELRAGGVEAVELSSIVALTAEHFLDSMHLTAEGNRLAASAVSGHLRSVR